MYDREFMIWIYCRLINVHKEMVYTDYMYRLRSIIDLIPEDQMTGVDSSDPIGLPEKLINERVKQ